MAKETYTATRLRIYIGEKDQWQGRSLYHAIVARAKEAGLGGATVFRGAEGYGSHSEIHSARIVDLAAELPLLVEIIDKAAAIEAFLLSVDDMVSEGLITLEEVEAIRYRREAKDK